MRSFDNIDIMVQELRNHNIDAVVLDGSTAKYHQILTEGFWCIKIKTNQISPLFNSAFLKKTKLDEYWSFVSQLPSDSIYLMENGAADQATRLAELQRKRVSLE